MNIFTTLILAVREVRRHMLRSVLTTLGIVIGVAAVILLVTLGRGAQAEVTSTISNLGRNLLILVPERATRSGGGGATAPFRLEDIQAIARDVPNATVAPQAASSVLVIHGNESRPTAVTGIDNQWFKAREWNPGSGRTFSETELRSGRPVCVIGATVAMELFKHRDPIGASLRIGRVTCEIVGVLDAKGASLGSDPDDVVLVPLGLYHRRIAGNRDIGMAWISAHSGDLITKVQSEVTGLMRERRRLTRDEPDDFAVKDMKEIAKTIGQVTSLLTAFLGAIAAVSLIVGGVGIMNIMLVSVKERTREIGIRMSIGAMEGEVMRQFLVEAVTLSVLGGLIGVAGGLIGSAITCHFIKLPFVFDLSTVLLAFGFSASVGVIFGYFPARQAARLNPIEALRYE